MITLVYPLLLQHKPSGDNTKQLQTSSTQPTDAKPQDQQAAVQKMSAEELLKDVPPDKLAAQLNSVAIEGLMDEELSDSGGEGMYRERDEFVVRNEDIERLEVCCDFNELVEVNIKSTLNCIFQVVLCTIYCGCYF